MELSVRKRIHCGMGRFCLAFFASFCLMRKVFWDGCAHTEQRRVSTSTAERGESALQRGNQRGSATPADVHQ